MGTLLRIGWINLRRDRVAQALTFILPIVFFSIFATVFGGQGDATTARIRIAVVDEDHSEFSREADRGLRKEKSLRSGRPRTSRKRAPRSIARPPNASCATATSRSPSSFRRAGRGIHEKRLCRRPAAIQLLADMSDPHRAADGLGHASKVAMTAAPDR